MSASTISIPKKELLALLDALPDDVDIEELIHTLYLREKLEASERDIREGATFSTDELRAQAESWLA